jgi:hypothetical protein
MRDRKEHNRVQRELRLEQFAWQNRADPYQRDEQRGSARMPLPDDADLDNVAELALMVLSLATFTDQARFAPGRVSTGTCLICAISGFKGLRSFTRPNHPRM